MTQFNYHPGQTHKPMTKHQPRQNNMRPTSFLSPRPARHLGLMATGLIMLSQSAWAEDLTDLKSRYSYTLGVQVAAQLQQKGLDVDATDFAEGIRVVLAGEKPSLSVDDMRTALEAYRDKMQESQDLIAKANLETGKQFLAENGKKDGVTTLDSGLQYRVITPGTGEKPTADATVTLNYEGSLIDGTVFDSSYQRKSPASFPVSGVIPGFSEAIQNMPVGSKWEVFIPSELGYGERGTGSGSIGPNETLIFQIELISIDK